MAEARSLRLKQQGATLVELVMTIVIISIAIAGVVGAFSLIAGRSADPLNQTRAVALSQLYMDEILTKRFSDDAPVGGGEVSASQADCATPGPEGETRANYDDVDDYQQLSAVPDKPPRDGEGNDFADYRDFEVTVTVACDGSGVGLDSHQAKRVDITITDPSGALYRFSAYRGNF